MFVKKVEKMVDTPILENTRRMEIWVYPLGVDICPPYVEYNYGRCNTVAGSDAISLHHSHLGNDHPFRRCSTDSWPFVSFGG